MKRINQNKEDKNQDNQIKNNQKNKNESKNNINNEKNINHNNHNNNNTNNDNKTKNETNKNNTNTKKKTRRKIALPRIKDIQTTPDTSLLHPILEDNLVMCIHGGKVNLKAKNAKRIQSNHIPIMLNNEIQGASISGCLNPPILGGPCSKVALVFPYTFTQHQVNNKRAVLQMGLIGVSDKAYPILAIPKKNTIKFSPMKLKANPLDKIEYERIQWEGIKKEGDNATRIETSLQTLGIDDPPLIDMSEMFIPVFNSLGLTTKVAKAAKNVGKSLSREEALGIIEKLEKGTSQHIRLVKDKKELDKLWEGLTRNATKIEERQVSITNKRTGQITQETLTRYQLDDKTEIVYRTGSSSGGETINVYGKNPTINKTIHIKE